MAGSTYDATPAVTGPVEPTPAPPEMLTTSQAATALNIHPKTVRRWIDEGRMAAVQLPSGHWRIARTEVDRLLGRSQDPPPADEDPPAGDHGPD